MISKKQGGVEAREEDLIKLNKRYRLVAFRAFRMLKRWYKLQEKNIENAYLNEIERIEEYHRRCGYSHKNSFFQCLVDFIFLRDKRDYFIEMELCDDRKYRMLKNLEIIFKKKYHSIIAACQEKIDRKILDHTYVGISRKYNLDWLGRK